MLAAEAAEDTDDRTVLHRLDDLTSQALAVAARRTHLPEIGEVVLNPLVQDFIARSIFISVDDAAERVE